LATHNFLVTVILAVKDPKPRLLDLCINSFAALSNSNQIEFIVVASGDIPEILPSQQKNFGKYKYINVDPLGVYSAYNEGVKLSSGKYILFFGVDDIALPGMDKIINQLKHSNCHMFACACFMQNIGISKPSKYNISLLFRNWCHQGIFYLKNILEDHPYKIEYIVQADHELNIYIASRNDLVIDKSSEVIAYFSSGGLTSQYRDLKFRKDFPALISQSFGIHYGLLISFKLFLVDIFLGRPETRFKNNID